MKRNILFMALAATCASCEGRQPTQANQAFGPVNVQLTDIPEKAPQTIKSEVPRKLPEDAPSAAEERVDLKSALGAEQVLQRFGSLLEQRRFAEAHQLWSDEGRASGMNKAQFVTAYDRYAEIHSETGASGPMEGAAGSAYVEIPFSLFGKLKTGEPFNLVGPAILRRVNDVPGSTAEQRKWHIFKIELQPRP